MVALPDYQLYYDEQAPEWLREELDVTEYLVPPEAAMTWHCGQCNEPLASQGLDMLWDVIAKQGLTRQAGVPIGIRCPCGHYNEWREKAWGELHIRRSASAGEEYDMPSYARKIDANHGAVKRAAQSFGVFVIDTYQVAQFDPGFPDMMWLIPWSPTHDVRMIEVKDGFDKKLTPAEHKWINEWRDNGGVCLVIHSVDEAIMFLKGMRRGG